MVKLRVLPLPISGPPNGPAALARIRPSVAFRIATSGCVNPAGQVVRYGHSPLPEAGATGESSAPGAAGGRAASAFTSHHSGKVRPRRARIL